MKSLNKCQVIGNLGKEIELITIENGDKVVAFSLAANDDYKDKNGALVKQTEWIRCVAWGKVAEILAKYTETGSKLYIEGKLKTRAYNDAHGVKHYVSEINVRDFLFLSKIEDRPTPEDYNREVDDQPKEDLPF